MDVRSLQLRRETKNHYPSLEHVVLVILVMIVGGFTHRLNSSLCSLQGRRLAKSISAYKTQTIILLAFKGCPLFCWDGGGQSVDTGRLYKERETVTFPHIF